MPTTPQDHKPKRATKAKRQYEVAGRKFTWHPLQFPDEAPLPDIVIPLRLKMKVVNKVGGDRDLDTDAMSEILEQMIPGQTEVLDEMDANDFAAMFTAWQEEYQKLSGATLGE